MPRDGRERGRVSISKVRDLNPSHLLFLFFLLLYCPCAADFFSFFDTL